MTITRRNLLLGAASTIAYLQLGTIQAKSDIKIASKAGDQKMVASMCRALYPHKRFPDNIYMDVAAGAIKKGNADTGSKIMFRAGLDGLQAKKFDKLSFGKQTKYLKSIIRSTITLFRIGQVSYRYRDQTSQHSTRGVKYTSGH